MKNTLKDMPIYSQISAWITSFFGMLTLSEWAILIGILVTILGFVRESCFKKRMIELEEMKVGVRNKHGDLIDEEND